MDAANGTQQLSFLVVDDVAMARSVLKAMLSRFGDVHTAASGMDALKVFHGTTEDGATYDLMLFDIAMPGMDGITLLEKIRGFEQSRDMPATLTIMTSALDKRESVRRAFQAGAAGYLLKPLSLEKVVGELRRLALIGE